MSVVWAGSLASRTIVLSCISGLHYNWVALAACMAVLYTCGRSITRDWTAAARAQMIDRPQGACLLEPAAVSLSSSSQQLSSMLSS
jgi:hypothetical protein